MLSAHTEKVSHPGKCNHLALPANYAFISFLMGADMTQLNISSLFLHFGLHLGLLSQGR